MGAQTNITRKVPWVRFNKESHTLLLGGPWQSLLLKGMDETIKKLPDQLTIPLPKSIPIEWDKSFEMDTAGAFLIRMLMHTFAEKGISLKLPSSYPELKKQLDQYHFEQMEPPSPPLEPFWKTALTLLGRRSLELKASGLDLFTFFGKALLTWCQALLRKEKLRWVSIIHHMTEVGLKAFPIIGLISFLIGVVLAYQSIHQLRRFGAELYTVDFLGIAVLREIGVLLTAIVVAGRSGSAYTAQIGTMKLNQEIDALQALNLDPMHILIIPRLLALIFSLPILVFWSDILGLLGGMMMTFFAIDMAPAQYLQQLQRAVSATTFWVGMVKTPLFALLIGLVGCYRGTQVKGNAESVGRMTTQAVVESIFLVIVSDALLSVVFSYLEI